MTDFGIAIAQEDHGMEDGRWKFDSRRKKVTVDVHTTPKHLDVFNNFSGGTKWAMSPNTVYEEELFKIEHEMPWPPKFLCYFYILDTPVGFAALIGQYDINRTFQLVNAFPNGTERLYAKVDEKYFYIMHRADNGANSLTAYGSDYKYRVRYEIMNQKALFTGQ